MVYGCFHVGVGDEEDVVFEAVNIVFGRGLADDARGCEGFHFGIKAGGFFFAIEYVVGAYAAFEDKVAFFRALAFAQEDGAFWD